MDNAVWRCPASAQRPGTLLGFSIWTPLICITSEYNEFFNNDEHVVSRYLPNEYDAVHQRLQIYYRIVKLYTSRKKVFVITDG
jgi:hypothetical protein